jgi:hypothetical protein
MTEHENRIEELEDMNKELKSNVEKYKRLYYQEKEKKNEIEEKLELAKGAAKKGLHISKDVFQVTKNVFGKAKSSFKEEWEKQRVSEEQKESNKKDKENKE